MTLKQIIDEGLDASQTLMQVAELQKVADAINKIPNTKLNDPSINQQKEAFAKLVAAQLQQKKLLAQQAQAQQQAQQQTRQTQTQQQTQQVPSTSNLAI